MLDRVDPYFQARSIGTHLQGYKKSNLEKYPRWGRQFAWAAFLSVLIGIFGLKITSVSANATPPCDYYASPTGSGDGRSASTPFKIANFWSKATPGSSLCLLDGTYTGVDSMIDPPDRVSGALGKFITVRALNDGKVTIDGQGKFIPVYLYHNNYFVLEGFNAHSSKNSVVKISNSEHNIVRRVAAWDAADGNTEIFGAHNSNDTLWEDVAGWGIARKIFQSSYGGNNTTCRRCWGSWDGSHWIGPKMTYTLAYNNYVMTIENSIGTWSGQRMKETYQLGCPDSVKTGSGQVSSGTLAKCGATFANFEVDQPTAIFGVDGVDSTDKKVNSKILGSISYITANDRFHADKLYLVIDLDSVEYARNVAYISPEHSKHTFVLRGLRNGTAQNLVARDLIGIGGKGADITTNQWKISNLTGVPSFPKDGSIFKNFGICKRYVDGNLTDSPLWPWPMNQRIIDAKRQSGKAAVDVTQTIETLFGTIPNECKTINQSPLSRPNLRIAEQ